MLDVREVVKIDHAVAARPSTGAAIRLMRSCQQGPALLFNGAARSQASQWRFSMPP
jgi:hypothetical protein